MRRDWFRGTWKNVPAIIALSLVGLAVAAGLAFLFGFVVLWLWNWLMPGIFGLPTISYWQAWGLVLLSHILLKSTRTGPPPSHRSRYKREEFRRRMHERFREDHDDPDRPGDEPTMA